MLRIQVCSIHGIFDHATCPCMLHTWNLRLCTYSSMIHTWNIRSCCMSMYDPYMESLIMLHVDVCSIHGIFDHVTCICMLY
ncbi:hypothetical protein LINGRAHAP2_LOCUS29357, partial [Linum grandiflorum]